MVMMVFSRLGLLLSGIFGLIFLICFFLVCIGGWQSVFLIWMITLPFSLMCHELMGWLQASLGFSHEARAWYELVLLGLLGLVEFYFIGFFLGRGWKKL
ncbi:hypothetical protein [Xanthomonas translucens]|uniref:hypothetical protein n=1 Tax=Xanthomonas campestris pv. translucens TaxID=343 RepID=UPI0012D7E22F|nr:hypothetical protein [Xanthomonas translucens]